mgnify:CR=1 FL=1
MKVVLAGTEKEHFMRAAAFSGIKHSLISYYHWKDGSPAEKLARLRVANEYGIETICDSGLFTLMFGAGKGGTHDIGSMTDYTKTYIETMKRSQIEKLTIVESDVHKLLGMDAVFELRKYFEDCGLPVMYVWHKEEGIDGLMRMAERYEYIALSIPELRILCSKNGQRYQTVTHSLLQNLRRHCGAKLPKIHLLGNTVQETMQTTLAYSCDSTSWLSGGRYGTVIDFKNSKLSPIRRADSRYKLWAKEVFTNHRSYPEIVKQFSSTQTMFEYMTSTIYSAMSMKRFQEYLDINYPWIGLRSAHEKQGERTDCERGQNHSKPVEPESPERVHV